MILDMLFQPGRIVATPGALVALAKANREPAEFFIRHFEGDWGSVSPDDARENEFSLRNGFRILSAYWLEGEVKLLIITEADRSASTIMLPEEY